LSQTLGEFSYSIASKEKTLEIVVALLKTSWRFLGDMKESGNIFRLESEIVLTSNDGFLLMIFNDSRSYAEIM
jgi:hypothetical protein